MDIRFVYITAGTMDEARSIGRALVSSRLAACVNVVSPIQSFYWWEGTLQEDNEVAIVAKTRKDLVSDLVEKVRSLHSYECPCIVTLPILEGHKPFLAWVARETRKTPSQ